MRPHREENVVNMQNVIVGLDGSPASLEAVRWAAWLSQETKRPLIVVHAFGSDASPALRTREFHVATEARHRAQATRWLRDALDNSPFIPFGMRLLVSEGAWEQVLDRQAQLADGVLVLGVTSPGADAFSALAQRRAFPVVLVPDVTTAPAHGSDVAPEAPAHEEDVSRQTEPVPA
jgi:nucleotide-binding universal stress UspA family protein